MITLATVNVNGVRAAARRGMGPWLDARAPDVLCLQEVRASDDDLHASLGDGWCGVHQESLAKGRAGVAVMSRVAPVAVRTGLETLPPLGMLDPADDVSGRWVEGDFALDADASGAALLTAVSCYVHTGEADTPRQDEKYRFLDAMLARLTALAADGRHVVLTGDLNVAHREADLKNWKGNLKKAGFLPQERAWFDALFEQHGWVDVLRRLVGEGPGPYTWWSWRGKAFDVDSGWRIDYQVASPGLAQRAVKIEIDRAATYAERWSDHAPVVCDYDVTLG